MGKNILIVDDNPDLIFSVKTGLEAVAQDFKITGLNSAKECFDYLKNNPNPDLILLDIMMPDVDGWDMFDHLKTNDDWKDIPIIFLTARTDEAAKKAGNLMANDFIEKPFDIMDLKCRIEKAINN